MVLNPILIKEDIEKVVRLIEEGKLSIKDGSGVIGEFERNFASYHGRRYALAQNSGTAAIHSAFFALGIRKGDEVLMPAFGWHADVTPLLVLGAKPVFCNINPKTLNIDPDELERRVTKKTKAIFVIHLFGHPADMGAVMHIAEKYQLKIVEDCSHAFGAVYKGKKVGSFGDIACFSLQQSKGVSGGEGGVMVTDNEEYFDRAVVLGHPARKLSEKRKEYEGLSLGFKYRPHPVAISLANSQLKRLDEINEAKQKVWDYLTEKLKDIKQIDAPHTSDNCKRGGFYNYRVRYKSEFMRIPKKEFLAELRRNTRIFADENFLLLFKLPFFEKDDYFNINYRYDASEFMPTIKTVKELFFIKMPSVLTDNAKKIIDADFEVLKWLVERYSK